jgi:hypothetical protein
MLVALGRPVGPDYDPATLPPLIEAVQSGELAVEAVNVNTHQVEVLPRWFWLGGWDLAPTEDRRSAILQSRLNGQPHGPAYRAPQVVRPSAAVATAPATAVEETTEETADTKGTADETAQRLSWSYAEKILEGDTPLRRWRGRINVAELARLVQADLAAIGRRVKLGSIILYIRAPLRAWEKGHPKR